MSPMMMEDEDGVLSKKQSESQSAEDDRGGSVNGGAALKKGPWTAAEDAILVEYVKMHGEGNWNAIQKHSGLSRCGKSCRLRWANHLRPNLKKGAFTQEEEQLIIELHAKMGNKWARMAAHLPGRTDNEIKNYWNTRIKRQQRAGLPLYPPELSLQTFQESPLGLDMCGIDADKGHYDLLQANSYEIPDFVCDSLRANQGLIAYDPELFDITARSLTPSDGFMSPAMHRQKHLRESANLLHGFSGTAKNEFSFLDQFQDDPGDNISQSFGLDFPFDPDPSMMNLPSLGENQGSPTLSDCDFSASKPNSCAVKLELPSLQYPESLLGSSETSSSKSVGTLMQSPYAEIVESDCPSPRNSGLLDALLHEAKALCNAKNNSSDKSSNSSTVDVAQISSHNICETECEDYADALSPLGHTATSLVSDCMPISASGSSSNDQLSSVTFTGCNVKPEPVDQTWATYGKTEAGMELEFAQPDALLVSDWLEGGKDEVIMTDAIASLLGDDLSNEYKQMASGASSRGLGIGFFAWNNMPPVCQMSELP